MDQLFEKHLSSRRNEKIAQVFHARKLIDRFGGGTWRILRLCEEEGLPVPEFSEESDGFQVRFIFKEPIGPQKVGKTIEDLTPRQAEIIQALRTYGPLSTKDHRQKIPNPLVERRLRDELNRLQDRGLISSEGATNAKKLILINK